MTCFGGPTRLNRLTCRLWVICFGRMIQQAKPAWGLKELKSSTKPLKAIGITYMFFSWLRLLHQFPRSFWGSICFKIMHILFAGIAEGGQTHLSDPLLSHSLAPEIVFHTGALTGGSNDGCGSISEKVQSGQLSDVAVEPIRRDFWLLYGLQRCEISTKFLFKVAFFLEIGRFFQKVAATFAMPGYNPNLDDYDPTRAPKVEVNPEEASKNLVSSLKTCEYGRNPNAMIRGGTTKLDKA